MSYMLTNDAVKQAFDRVEPMRSAEHVLKRQDGYVLVADASRPYNVHGLHIVGARTYGDPQQWEHPFMRVCMSKGDICWRTGLSTREIVHLKPWLLEDGDTPWEGGIIMDDIIVAYSGAAAEDDEAIAFGVMGWVRAYCFRQSVFTGLWTSNRADIGTPA